MAAPTSQFRPGQATNPTSKVEISVSCRNLKDKDVFSHSDPLCVLYAKEMGVERWREMGRTESIKDTLNPDFVKKFVMDYHFEESQKLRFDVYDQDSPSAKLERHDYLGSMECTLGQMVGGMVEKPLTGPGRAGKWGTILVRAEEIGNCKEVAQVQFSAHKLDKKDFLGKSDPFLVFSRCNPDMSWTVVHKTEVIKNNLNPTWRPFTLKVQSICGADYNRQIKVDCYDWDSDGSHDFIGSFTTTMKQLVEGSHQENTYDVINPKKHAKKKNYKNSGTCSLLSIKIEQEQTFLDYVNGGLDINFTVAIDFTASNGNPSSPTSLHYRNPYQPNQYASALLSVGEIIQDYDTDKMFPALGFGARVPPRGEVSHEFFLNGHPSNPYCSGIQGLMEAYDKALSSIQLYGPTNFSPVINHVARFAAASKDGSNYFILLILTDGVITDMPQTKQAIVAASKLPMSIIIIGVGEADFDAMEELDSDNVRLQAYGQYAERDIVQFVPFRDFMRRGNSEMQKAYLAKEVLAEVPAQVLGYMRKIGVKPKPPNQNVRKITAQAPPAGPPGGQPTVPGQAPPGHPQAAPGHPPPQHGAPYPGAPPSYPGAPQGGAPYPGAGAPQGAPYPGAGAPPGGAPYPATGASQGAPYPGAGAPYPGAGAKPGGAPYPGAQAGSAPYPNAGPPGGSPYHAGGQYQAAPGGYPSAPPQTR
ncbi:copine-8-like isoform X2 [Lineus longissimus]|uniref:copine-8-like isoform X2 n=1 Tax=Lineus longissimus TaxID=88925 RepID=UPI002B4F7C37